MASDPAINIIENTTPISTPHLKNITSLDWSKNGRWLITSSEDMVVVWEASCLSTPTSNRDSTSPFRKVCQIPAHSYKISICTFLEPQLSLSDSNSIDQGPPFVIIGEYQCMHIWKINGISGSIISPMRMTSIPNCHVGVISCIDTCSDESFDNPTLLVASSSGGVENNLNLWKFTT